MTYSQKLARAEGHFATLDADLGRYIFDKETCAVRPDTSENGKQHSFFWTLHKEPPPEWGPLIGDTLHNLRCTLDHIVWELADPALRGNHTMFPVISNPGDWDAVTKKGPKAGQPAWGSGLHKLLGVGPSPLAIIEAAQPYRWTGKPDHPGEALRILNELENIDKHREFHAVAATGEVEKTEFPNLPDGESVQVTPFSQLLNVDQETEVLRIVLPSHEAAVDMSVDLSFAVLFAETGEIDGWPIDVALKGLIGAVRGVTDDLKAHLP